MAVVRETVAVEVDLEVVVVAISKYHIILEAEEAAAALLEIGDAVLVAGEDVVVLERPKIKRLGFIRKLPFG